MGIADQLGGAGVGTKATKPTNPPKTPRLPEPQKVEYRLPPQLTQHLQDPLPADTEAPATIIAACEKRIDASVQLRTAITHYGEETFYRYAGPAVRQVYRTKAWQKLVNPDTGRPYRGFRPWCKRHGISKSQAYRMIDEEPVRDALALEPNSLQARQVAILAPVLRQHGAVVLRKVWATAKEMGGTDPKTLEKARDAMALTMAREDAGEPESQSSKTPILRVQPGQYDESLVRAYARQDPGTAELVAHALLDEVTKQRAVISEDD